MLKGLTRRRDKAAKIDQAFRRVEKVTAVGALLSGLELLRVSGVYSDDSLNSWPITRTRLPALTGRRGRLLGWAVKYPNVIGVAGIRAASAGLLLIPGLGRIPRAIGLGGTVGTGALLHLRTQYGNDGSDDFAVINFTTALIEKFFPQDPFARQLALGFIAAQSALSYYTSGAVKLNSHMWRSGQALPGVLRTATYGDSWLYGIFRHRPRLAAAASWSVMMFEVAFPLALVLPKPLSRTLLVGGGVFHLANGLFMGLNRFMWSFTGSYPAVMYFSEVFTQELGTVNEWSRTRKLAVLAGGAVSVGAVVATRAVTMIQNREQPQEQHEATAPGQFLDLPTGKIHAMIEGRDNGQPVVFESAMAMPCTGWHYVVTELADEYRTICYDRAGNGWSPKASAGDTSASATMARTTAVLGLSGNRQVILVGHSVGGLLALIAASQEPDKVCGLVLVDSSHPDQLDRSRSQREGLPVVAHGMHRMRSPRHRKNLAADDLGMADLPPEVRDITVERLREISPWRGAIAEFAAWQADWSDAAARAVIPKDLPLAVVTAGKQETLDKVHGQLQEEFAALSELSQHFRVEGADHDSLVLNARYAKSVADAIRWVHGQGANDDGAKV